MAIVAGIFFADDYVTYGVASCSDESTFPAFHFTDIAISRSSSLDTPYQDTQTAMDAIRDYLSQIGLGLSDLKSVATASLGPHSAKQVGELGHGIHSTGLRREAWDGFDLVTEIKGYFPNELQNQINVFSYIDAEAIALGEYFLRFRPTEESSSNPIPQATIAVLLADEGVGGAVIKRKDIFRGDMHTELGHMRINVHKKDNNVERESRIGRRLTHLASLSAIERRWRLTYEDYLNLPETDPYLKFLGYYYGQATANITMFYTPTVIRLIGRMFDHPNLISQIRKYYREFSSWPDSELLYPGYPVQQIPEKYITVSDVKDAGIIGCFCGAMKGYQSSLHLL